MNVKWDYKSKEFKLRQRIEEGYKLVYFLGWNTLNLSLNRTVKKILAGIRPGSRYQIALTLTMAKG